LAAQSITLNTTFNRTPKNFLPEPSNQNYTYNSKEPFCKPDSKAKQVLSRQSVEIKNTQTNQPVKKGSTLKSVLLV